MVDMDIAKDLVQDVFIKLWEKDTPINPNQSVKALLYTAVRNACLNFLRQEAIEEKRLSVIISEDSDSLFEEAKLEEDVHAKLYRAINQLSSRSKESILLTIHGYSNQEIAEEMQISVNSVKTLKQRAYRLLRDDLKNDFKLFQFFFI